MKLKLDQKQVDSLENVRDREELCEKIYAYILANKDAFKEYPIDYSELKMNIYTSFDLLISLLLTDNETISQLIVWDVILRKDVLKSQDVQQFINGSNLRAKDLLSVLEFNELRDN
ncbi:hypothetical protein [Acinetobacter haemolyticus]|uniref:Uncharacterized protein n=1 Tax=Acinetobacter haemolyticus TaxID=29430 RepID=A0A4P7B5Y7_ACIHA|nr:hypothetical protein [Acinetobacter haemolyticus]QBQ17122.1 hypothetical protein AHTJR_12965 [Acinetobacter haemolyticus]